MDVSALTQPIRFTPLLKRTRWGGIRLGSVLRKPLGPDVDFAESWEICDHGPDQSRVTFGVDEWLVGQTLHQLVLEHGDDLFGRQAGFTQFPLLFKYLDVCDRLSVQVHPNDEQAARLRPGENGKNEAWYILDAGPDSLIYVGLKTGVGREDLKRALAEGEVERCLHRVRVKPGDCLFIPAGTVHAVGNGVLIAEVQQSSDATFRLYDWGRLGTDGRPRPLHVVESLECIDFERGPVEPVRPIPLTPHMASLSSKPEDHQVDLLVRCPHFEVHRHRTTIPFDWQGNNDCRVLMVVKGSGTLRPLPPKCDMPGCERAEIADETLTIGDTILLPASAGVAKVIPDGELIVLETLLPDC